MERLTAWRGDAGKVNLDEFTYGSSSESSAFQPSPRNPAGFIQGAGGSSGGSAAGCREGALNDTAGSIRQPAAFCGGGHETDVWAGVTLWVDRLVPLDCPDLSRAM